MEIINSNKMEEAQNIINDLSKSKVKVIKKDAGLLEREKMNDNKVILSEDNRQILLG